MPPHPSKRTVARGRTLRVPLRTRLARGVDRGILIPIASALASALLSGCAAYAPPQPWEKGMLARPDMQLEPDVLDARLTRHVYTSKEAGSGGYGVGGGGCGCN